MTEPTRCDVLILSGGLAGLCLAVQLRRRFPDIDVVVLERKRHPVPVAAHKVGESTVEIGAQYFAETLGLREHLDAEHIRKFGFRFFWSEGREDLEGITELGVSRVMPTPTWQIDRGVFENHLRERVHALGARFIDAATVRAIDVGQGDQLHHVRATIADADQAFSARWLVDASGRAGLVKRKLGLAEANGHDVNSVWFRIDARLSIDAWCDDPTWGTRCSPPERWRSTNHLCGEGYWVWLIPLGSGAHSVGIVCDARRHPLERMNTFDKALDWLREHQPLVARHCEAQRGRLMDFLFLRGFSYGCKQVFSGDRWALTGEAGVFLDPFYSPGSDFIAIANTYICELVAHDREGRSIAPYARLYEQLYFSFYENTLSLYRDQYAIFGDAEIMAIKIIWDYAYYWGILCPLFFQERLADLAVLGDLREDMLAAATLNRDLQALFRRWYAHGTRESRPVMWDQGKLDWFLQMNRALRDRLDADGTRVRVRDGLARLRDLAATITTRAVRAGIDTGLPAPDSQGSTPLFARVA